MSQSKVIGRDPQLSLPGYTASVQWLALLHTIYRRRAQTDSPNTHWVYCYLMDRGVCLFVCFLCGFFFSSFIRKKNCVTAHPDLALLPRADLCTGCHAFKTTFPRHLIVTNCTVKLSTGSACLWCTERRQQHSRSDPKHKSPVTSHTKKTTSILSMHIKVIVLLWYTVHRQSSSWLHLHTNTCCYTSVQCYSKVTDFKLN